MAGRTTAARPAAHPVERSARGGQRLAAADWVRAALDVMVDEGIAGVKVQRLCERLGVTKGSFYWHFADLDAFLGEVARVWAEDGARIPGPGPDAASDPDAQLLHAMQVFADPRNRNLARAMRDWAQNDERARAAIRAADEDMFDRLTEAMVRCGFDPDEAAIRAKILYYSGVGFAHVGELGPRASTEHQLRKTWELLTQP
jgi:AcrR family transcriptional regulator